MLSIDEAIEQFKTMANDARGEIIHGDDLEPQEKYYNSQLESYVEEHEQLAEWLEELKAYREIGTVEECKNSVLDIQKAYNKAIDDCKELTFREVVYCDSLNDRTEFRELAEQLNGNKMSKGVTEK